VLVERVPECSGKTIYLPVLSIAQMFSEKIEKEKKIFL
jgi:hypothetical protein